MSKSKKNVIDPENIINNYGADSVRLFILSDSPPEKDVQWSDQGMLASYKFIQKLWLLHNKIKDKINANFTKNEDLELDKFTNQMIVKITNNLENFNYNVIIANLYETYNFLVKKIEEEIDSKKLLKNYQNILNIFNPIIPHFTNECLEDLKLYSNLSWPNIEKEHLSEDTLDYVVQINGKKRAILKAKKDLDKENLLNQIKSNNMTNKYLKNKSIKKTIFVKNRLINLLLNE